MKILDDHWFKGQPNRQSTAYIPGRRGSVYLKGKQWYDLKVESRNESAKSEMILYWELPEDTQSDLGFQGIFRKIIPAQTLSPISKSGQAPARVVAVAKRAEPKASPAQSLQRTAVIHHHFPTEKEGELTHPPVTLRLEKGKAVVLPQVQFAQSSASLLIESYSSLNQLVDV